MEKSEDSKHTNEFGEVEVFKDTKYWFKKDIQTFKRAFLSTIKNIPIIFTVIFIIILLGTFLSNSWVNLQTVFVYSLLFLPLLLLGYFMFYIMAKKGYDIDPYAGTHINTPEHANRFSVSYILNSDMPKKRKAVFLMRFIFYLLMIIGLLMTVFRK